MVNKLRLRKANLADVDKIFEIAKSVQIASIKDSSTRKKGFLYFVHSIEEYREIIRNSKHCLVMEDELTVLGYLLALDKVELTLLNKFSEIEMQTAINHLKNDEIIYIDQIAVLRQHQSKGVAQAMLDYLVEMGGDKILIAAIIEKPIQNKRSLQFFVEKNGWKRIAEVRRDQITAGIYSSS